MNNEKMKVQDQEYDAWLHWIVTDKCSFRCEYCFSNIEKKKTILSLFKPKSFFGDPRVGRAEKINVSKVITSLNKTGKRFLVGLSGGGEPFLVPNFLELCKALTEKHLILLNTNFATGQVDKFIEEIDPSKVQEIYASFHFAELERRKMIDKFVTNVVKAQTRGFNIRVHCIAYPKTNDQILKYSEFLASRNISLNVGFFCGEYEGKHYPEGYTEEEIKKYNIIRTYSLNNKKEKFYCNAGYNAVNVDSSGNVFVCNEIKTKLGNIYKGFKLNKSMTACSAQLCGCPYYLINNYLFAKAKAECRSK